MTARTPIRHRDGVVVALTLVTLLFGTPAPPQEQQALVVEDVLKDSAAAKAVPEVGDRVLSYDGNDSATARFMERLYRGLFAKGLTPAAALRAAQVQMWKRKQWRSLYYWSAFVLQGDWR
jgi:CHAT domain-containing protein